MHNVNLLNVSRGPKSSALVAVALGLGLGLGLAAIVISVVLAFVLAVSA